MTTTVTDPKLLAAKYNQAFNAHNETALRSLISPNARFSAPGDVRLEGKDAVIGYTNSWMKALPDATITVTNEIVNGPWIAQEFTFAGTHRAPLTGPMGTIQPTNRKVSGQCVSITRYENDLAVESRLYFDVVQLLTQLGVMPVSSKN
ncbi:MAG TPA: ester cyclase [Candidatus Dormibacteraeota bacterium]|nr:ester cyclase [Candidatus Dormibacteraeota bacterium]